METAAEHPKRKSSKKRPWVTDKALDKIEERKEMKIKFGISSEAYRKIAKQPHHAIPSTSLRNKR